MGRVVVCVSVVAFVASAGVVLAGASAGVTPVYGAQQTLVSYPAGHAPKGVAVDAAGDVYVADTFKSQIVELAAGSDSATVLPLSGLSFPAGVAVDATGDVYVADTGNNRIVELAAGSSSQTTLPFTGLDSPLGVAVDAAGDVYVADTYNGQIVELAAGATSQTTFPLPGLSAPFGVAVDAGGDVYVADFRDSRILELAAGTRTVTTLPFTGLRDPYGVGVDAAGDVYVADTSNNQIVELAAGATSQTVLPFTGLRGPEDVAVDAAGEVYVADTDNSRVVELPTPSSSITFTAPSSAVYGASTTLTATGPSTSTPVVFSVDAASGADICSLGSDGVTLSYIGVGNCVVDADQAGAVEQAGVVQVQASIAVGPAALTVTVRPSTRLYGQPDPAFALTYTGLTNGDTAAGVTAKLDPTFTAKLPNGTVSSLTSPVGTYKVRVTGRRPSKTLPNYTISFVAGTMTVTNSPHVTAVTPATGPTTGGTAITITGTQFTTGDTVVIGQYNGTGTPAIAATNVVIVSPTTITAITGGNAKPGSFIVFVITNTGTHSPTTDKIHFTYTKPTA